MAAAKVQLNLSMFHGYFNILSTSSPEQLKESLSLKTWRGHLSTSPAQIAPGAAQMQSHVDFITTTLMSIASPQLKQYRDVTRHH